MTEQDRFPEPFDDQKHANRQPIEQSKQKCPLTPPCSMIIPNKSCFYTDGVGGRCKCQCHYLKPQEQSWKEEFEALIQGGYNQALSDYQEQLKKLL